MRVEFKQGVGKIAWKISNKISVVYLPQRLFHRRREITKRNNAFPYFYVQLVNAERCIEVHDLLHMRSDCFAKWIISAIAVVGPRAPLGAFFIQYQSNIGFVPYHTSTCCNWFRCHVTEEARCELILTVGFGQWNYYFQLNLLNSYLCQ